jgi:glycoside/pentoside/hexuronide:cation symporter, GPH family
MSQMALQSTAAAAAGRLSTSFKVVWGLAGFGTALISGIFGALLPIFYQDYLGLGAGWIALASGAYAIWNAINDPIFGYISDGTRSRLGRRIPYMRFTAPFLALTFILVWFVPRSGNQQAIFWWMLISMLLYDGCYTIVGLAYSALLPEVTESDQERNSLQISSSMFGMFGLLLGFVIPDLFRPKAGTSPSLLPLQMSMIVVAVVCAVLIIVTTLVVKERREFYEGDKPLPLGKALKTSLTSHSFQILVAQNFMSILVSSLVVGSVFYLADYVVPAPTIILLACIFVPLLIGIPLTTLLRARLGVAGAQQLLLVTAGIGLLLIMIAPPILIPVCLALAGLGLAGPQTLTNVLFAEVIDEDEIRSGVRREGAFFGINALITKPAQSLAIALSPFILALTHFVTRDQNGGQIFLNHPASALLGIRVIVGLIPGLAMLLGALILHWFPLRGQHLSEMQRQVLIMHANKHERLDNPS